MSIFKRPATHYGKSPEPETPYQKAAQVWDERIGSARVQACGGVAVGRRPHSETEYHDTVTAQ